MNNLRAGRLVVGAMAGVFILKPTSDVGSQEPRRLTQADSVPLELVTALIAGGSVGSDPQILVGSIPGWIANRIYVPANARVLGSAFQGTTVVGVISLPDEPERVIADYKRELASRGWTPPPPMTVQSFGNSGGFRSLPTSGQPGAIGPTSTPTRLIVCGDKQMLTVSATRRRGATTEVAIRANATVNYTSCNPPPAPAPRPSDSPYPTLFHPADSGDPRTNNTCYDMGGGVSGGTGATIRTPMDPAALLEHYARQLQDSGWQTTVKTASVGRSWFRQEPGGVPMEITLTITVPRDTTCRQLGLTVRVPTKKQP